MLFRTAEAASMLGMEPWQVQSYAKQGFVEPSVAPRGAGSRRAYDLVGLIKLAIINQLNRDGFDLRAIRPVLPALFDIPVAVEGDSPGELKEKLSDYFRDRVLLTCRRFRKRKIIKRERLTAALADLMCDHGGLYIVDLGLIVERLISRVAGPASESDVGDE
jgi:DNA-binding transcriptional MerR regulator